MAGTRWVQREILDENPEAELKISAVWFNMLPADDRSKWPEKLLTDSRATHYWDEQKLVGRFYGENVTQQKKDLVEWDAWVLYGQEAEWGEEGPSEMIGWGRTIVQTRERLRQSITPLLETQPSHSEGLR